MRHPILRAGAASEVTHGLGRIALILLMVLVIPEAWLVAGDFGRYSRSLDESGLPGLLSMPSVLVIQLAYIASAIGALFLATVSRLTDRPIALAALLLLAIAGYCWDVRGIKSIAGAGEFGYGAAFFFGCFGFYPGALYLYVIYPITIVRLLRSARA